MTRFPYSILVAITMLVLAAQSYAQSVQLKGLRIQQGENNVIRGQIGYRQMTSLSLMARLPDREILGLNKKSKIDSLVDDSGRVLLGPGAEPSNEALLLDAEKLGSGDWIPKQGIVYPQSKVEPDKTAIRVYLEAETLPTASARALHLTGELVVDVAGASETRLTATSISLSPDGRTDTRIRFDEGIADCSIDSQSNEPQGLVSNVYCFCQGFKPLRIVARGSESVATGPGAKRPNLKVLGPVDGLTIEFVMPSKEQVVIPLDLTFGLDLQMVK